MIVEYIDINQSFGHIRYLFKRILELKVFIFKNIIYKIIIKYNLLSKIVSYNGYRFNVTNNSGKLQGNKKRLVILRPDHIGDLVYSIPTIFMIHDLFNKEYSIEILVGKRNLELVEKMKIFSKVFVADVMSNDPSKKILPSAHEYQNLGKKIGKIDVLINLRIDNDLFHLMGCINKKTSIIINGEKVKYTTSNEVEIDRNERKIITYSNNLNSEIYITTFSSINKGLKLLKENNTESINYYINQASNFLKKTYNSEIKYKNYIIIGAEAGLQIKEWDSNKLEKFITSISENNLEKKIIILGIKNYYNINTKNKNVIDLRGKTTLEDAINLITRSEIFYGFDSGLTHIASLAGIKTVSIFNGSTDYRVWQPISVNNNLTIYSPDIYCSPCYISKIKQCKNKLRCRDVVEIQDITYEV